MYLLSSHRACTFRREASEPDESAPGSAAELNHWFAQGSRTAGHRKPFTSFIPCSVAGSSKDPQPAASMEYEVRGLQRRVVKTCEKRCGSITALPKYAGRRWARTDGKILHAIIISSPETQSFVPRIHWNWSSLFCHGQGHHMTAMHASHAAREM